MRGEGRTASFRGAATSTAMLVLAVSLSTTSCAKSTADALYPEAADADPRRHPYVIGAADVLRVTVWKDPNLSTEAAVGPGGTITLPLVGEIRAAGRTPANVQDEVAQRLAAYVKDAVITVAVVEVNSYRFTVAGSVEHRGMFTPRYYVTVSEAIALAGGPTRYAATSDVVVIRGTAAGHPRRIPIDYDKILSGRRPDEDIVILAGDTVLVP